MMTAVPTLLTGGSLWVDAGLLSMDEVCSPMQMILDNEWMGALQRFAHEYEISQETVGLETILEAGPGGHYLDKEHTVRHFREEHWNPTLWSRQMLRPWLESEHRIASVALEKLEPSRPPPIANSSDANWPAEIQASWPWYIMGVSQTWLSLIDQVRAEQPLEETSGDALLDYYGEVNARVTALWRDYGQHVYLHHLNALFGYAPLVIRETNLKRF